MEVWMGISPLKSSKKGVISQALWISLGAPTELQLPSGEFQSLALPCLAWPQRGADLPRLGEHLQEPALVVKASEDLEELKFSVENTEKPGSLRTYESTIINLQPWSSATMLKTLFRTHGGVSKECSNAVNPRKHILNILITNKQNLWLHSKQLWFKRHP